MSRLGPRKYSERLGVLDAEQLQSAADRFGLGTVTDAEPAPGGLFGQNVFLTTSEGDYVLRGNPHGHVQLTKERTVARLLHSRSSLPAPWPYEVCDDTTLFGWTYAVMPRLDGTTGSILWDETGTEGRVALAAAAGRALARMHEVTSDSFGPYDAQLDGFVGMEDFRDWALHRLEHWRSACRSINALSTDAERYIDDLLESCADELDEPFAPVLVHHDFKLGNLNLEPVADGYEATGVFDLFEAYLGDGEEDLVRMLWSVETDEQRAAFIDSYTDRHPLRPGSGARLAIYALADWLVIWEYGLRNGMWFEDGASFVATARPIVDRARAIGSVA